MVNIIRSSIRLYFAPLTAPIAAREPPGCAMLASFQAGLAPCKGRKMSPKPPPKHDFSLTGTARTGREPASLSASAPEKLYCV